MFYTTVTEKNLEATLSWGLQANVHPETVKTTRFQNCSLAHQLAMKKLDIFEASEAWKSITSVETVLSVFENQDG